MVHIVPVGAKLLILPNTEEIKASTLILPDSVKDKISPYTSGAVVTVGRGTKAEPTDKFKAGQVVMFPRASGTELQHNNVTYRVIEIADIIGEL